MLLTSKLSPEQWQVMEAVDRLTRTLKRPPGVEDIVNDIGTNYTLVLRRLDALGMRGWVVFPVEPDSIVLLGPLPPKPAARQRKTAVKGKAARKRGK